jgi:hypothetical protein
MLQHLCDRATTKQPYTEEEAATHILNWTKHLEKGTNTIARQLDRKRHQAQPSPVAFAMVTKLHGCIHLMHGFEEIAMDVETHEADGCLGFFLGNQDFCRPRCTVQPALLVHLFKMSKRLQDSSCSPIIMV